MTEPSSVEPGCWSSAENAFEGQSWKEAKQHLGNSEGDRRWQGRSVPRSGKLVSPHPGQRCLGAPALGSARGVPAPTGLVRKREDFLEEHRMSLEERLENGGQENGPRHGII